MSMTHPATTVVPDPMVTLPPISEREVTSIARLGLRPGERMQRRVAQL